MGRDPLGDVQVLRHGTDGHAGRQEDEERKVDLAQILLGSQVHAGHEAGHAHQGKDERAGEMVPLFGHEGDEADGQHQEDLDFISGDGPHLLQAFLKDGLEGFFVLEPLLAADDEDHHDGTSHVEDGEGRHLDDEVDILHGNTGGVGDDLKGKKVGYSSGTSSEDILKNALEKAGLTMNDITAVDMDASNIVTAMLSGGVDACATWSPNSLKILEEGKDLTKLCDNTTFSDKTVSLASWIVTPSYAEANADKILRFTKALFKAMDYAADDNYEEVAGYVAAQTKTDEASVYDQRGDADWLTGEEVARGAADGTVEKYYEIQQQNFIAAGAVEGEVPVSDYVMLDNMIEAGK